VPPPTQVRHIGAEDARLKQGWKALALAASPHHTTAQALPFIVRPWWWQPKILCHVRRYMASWLGRVTYWGMQVTSAAEQWHV
jgi:hypothetical protein